MYQTYKRLSITPQQLADIPFFKDLKDEYISMLYDKIQMVNVPKETLIISEGDTTQKKMFFIIEGTVSVFRKANNGKNEKICELGSPNFFGEMSIIDNGPRSASVEAKTDVVLAVLKWDVVKNIFDSNPEIMSYIFKNIACTLSMRLRRLNSLYSYQMYK